MTHQETAKARSAPAVRIAHLRAICERLGLFRVSYTTGTMVFRLHETAAPDPGKLYDAITHVDQRLFLSAGREPAVLLRMPGAKEEDMLPVSIRLMEKLEKALA